VDDAAVAFCGTLSHVVGGFQQEHRVCSFGQFTADCRTDATGPNDNDVVTAIGFIGFGPVLSGLGPWADTAITAAFGVGSFVPNQVVLAQVLHVHPLATHISTFVAMHFSFSGSRSLFGHGRQEAEGGVDDDRLKKLNENCSTRLGT
jgi:hypothetical protein